MSEYSLILLNLGETYAWEKNESLVAEAKGRRGGVLRCSVGAVGGWSPATKLKRKRVTAALSILFWDENSVNVEATFLERRELSISVSAVQCTAVTLLSVLNPNGKISSFLQVQQGRFLFLS